MKMTFRWFGTKYDTVPLRYIRQVAGVHGVITMLYDLPAGEVWPLARIRTLREEVEAAGLEVSGIESVNVHEAIKCGSSERDMYIERYIETLANLGREGIRMVCYNFMPVFDWTRTTLAKPRPDGSTVLAYDQTAIDGINPDLMFDRMDAEASGNVLPGWEPDRMQDITRTFALYREIGNEELFQNLVYFVKAIMPVCHQYDIRMAIHPDDPAWPVFGLPRVITGQESLLRLMAAVDDPHNGVTLCSGSLGTNPANDIPAIIASLRGRIHFAHVRNLRYTGPGQFEESAHLSSDGSMDMFAIMRALYDNGFDGLMRSDHGRAVWDEVAMPGYGLYDRAMGSAYLLGLWEAIEKMH